MVVEGPAGWGEFCPFPEYGDAESRSWLSAAVEQATVGGRPGARLDPVNVIVRRSARAGARRRRPVGLPHGEGQGCRPRGFARRRPRAGRGGPRRAGARRCGAGRRQRGLDVDTAVAAVRALDRAAGGLEYVEQPCATIDELAAVAGGWTCGSPPTSRSAGPTTRCGWPSPAPRTSRCSSARRWAGSRGRCGWPRRPGCRVSCRPRWRRASGWRPGLALAAALPELQFACGLATLALLDGDLVPDAGGLRPVDGRLPVARTPPAPDPALLDAHRMRDARARPVVARPARSHRKNSRRAKSLTRLHNAPWPRTRTGGCSSSATLSSPASATRNTADGSAASPSTRTAPERRSRRTTSASGATPATTSAAAGRTRWRSAGARVPRSGWSCRSGSTTRRSTAAAPGSLRSAAPRTCAACWPRPRRRACRRWWSGRRRWPTGRRTGGSRRSTSGSPPPPPTPAHRTFRCSRPCGVRTGGRTRSRPATAHTRRPRGTGLLADLVAPVWLQWLLSD
jgi:O-succinylbenzoate synthase